MISFKSDHYCEVNLAPIGFTIILHYIQSSSYMMVTVIYTEIMISLCELCAGSFDSIIPLLVIDSAIIQSQIPNIMT